MIIACEHFPQFYQYVLCMGLSLNFFSLQYYNSSKFFWNFALKLEHDLHVGSMKIRTLF
jgi:hypothetical protein